ncbi:DeoR family transcriptional regulator [Knoellia remsis]|uniref:DeoR family transcriptional regulator n=1 Tax=Knoellia remsis TaxID=407159 RepID=A0A2T0V0J0_9MICO|nr:DeoR/GlpR family DNA-binding transcription regulator [Knoellia remsis]PRY63682.1 DeoR family transcriptional regulator [Knoellia remsis]
MRQQRLNALIELISERGHVSIPDVEEALGVSAATARRDISLLAEQRLVTRTHGGATALGSAYELPLQYKIAKEADAKRAIARAVAQLVRPGEVLAVNGGTTTTEVVREIVRREDLAADASITVVTNALNIAYELSIRPNVTIVVTGGTARSQSFELIGPLSDDVLAKIVVDTAIIGVDGFSVRGGVTTIHPAEAKVSGQFIKGASRTIVVADHTKLDRVTLARIVDLEAVTTLVTDRPLPATLQEAVKASGIEVVVAPPGKENGHRGQ